MKAFPGQSGKHRMEGWGVFRKGVRDDQPWGREEPEAPGAVQGLSQGGGLERGQWSVRHSQEEFWDKRSEWPM